MSAPFDTLEMAKRLAAGGFTPQQAKTAATVFSEVLSLRWATLGNVGTIQLALEHKIETTKLEPKADIEALGRILEVFRLGLQPEIRKSNAEVIRWVGGILCLQALVIVGGFAAMLTLTVN